MLQLEQIKKTAAISGLEPGQVMRIVTTEPVGPDAVTVYYKLADGSVRERMLFRSDEPNLALAEAWRPWAFDAPGEAFKLVAEAYRINLAHLFDPMMAVHTSNVEPLPHQITAVYESMLSRQQSCQQLYLPRLKDDTVFQVTMAAGAESRDFFGFAQGRDEGKYAGFSYGERTSLIMDSSLLLIEPLAASAYVETLRAAEEAARAKVAEAAGGGANSTLTTTGGTPRVEEPGKPGFGTGGTPAVQVPKKQFYGSIELDPLLAKRQFADLIDEVVQQFTVRPGVKVRIAIEVQAESTIGFDDSLQRAVKENCSVLKFRNAEFEAGE